MDVVFLALDRHLTERIKQNTKGRTWHEIGLWDSMNVDRPSEDWESTLFALSGKKALIIYGLDSAETVQLERIRTSLSGAAFIAVTDRIDYSQLQRFINGHFVDWLYQLPDQTRELLTAVSEFLASADNEGISISEPVEGSIEESMVTSFYIYDLIYGDLDKARMMSNLRDKFGLLAYPNCALTIMVDNFWELCRDLDNKSRYGVKMEYLQLLRTFIKTSELESIACSLIGTDKLIALVHLPETSEKEGSRIILQMAANMKEYINKRAQRSVSIGVGNIYLDSRSIWKSYEESFKALEFTFYLGNDSVIQYEETKNFTTFRNSEDQLPIHKYNFFRNISQWSEAEIAAEYEDTLEGLFSRSFSSETIKSIVIKYNFEILDYLEQMDLPLEELHEYLIQSSSSILRAATIEMIRQINRDFIKRVARAIVTKRQGEDVRAAIDSAKAFIDKYYYRDLSLELMAQVSNLSPAYFSRKFKEQIGLNYTEYLEQTRLELAREYLVASSVSLTEIARKVGFNDYSYFSSRFRRRYGKSPTQFKQEQLSAAVSPRSL